MQCAQPATCASCYPTAAALQQACTAHSPKALCFSTYINGQIGAGCAGVMYPLDCDFDNMPPPANDCGSSPDRFCRDYFANVPCAGSLMTPN
jgi:hypothetical protein